MRTSTALAAAALTAILLAGCTPADNHLLKATHTVTAAASDAPALPPGVTQATAVPTDVANDPAQRKNVTLTDCAATEGGWKAAGTAKNAGESAITYMVTVFFTASTATVLAVGDTAVTVEPGSTARWAIESSFTAPAGTRCVLTGVAVR